MLRLDEHLGLAVSEDERFTYEFDLAGDANGDQAQKWKVKPWRPESWPLFRAQV